MSDTATLRSAIPSIDTNRPELFRDDVWQPLFAKLRAEDPVHYCAESRHGPYWSITRHADVFAVDNDPQTFSSSYLLGGVQIADDDRPNVITMDAPEHTARRKALTPVVSPKNLVRFEGLIRERARTVLDGLPRGVEFDWVQNVSVELTSMMLATLFGHPVEDRQRLIHWSDVTTADINDPDSPISTEEQRMGVLGEFHVFMNELVERRRNEPLGSDVISLLAHNEDFIKASPEEKTATFAILLVAGNDTTRNSMSGGLWGISQNPGQMELLKSRPNLITNAIAEMIRFQTPVLLLRRTATRDVEMHGRQILKGEKVVMWYISANRDETVFDDADHVRVDRENARQHLAFGMGPHRCLGSRLAELQLRILWEEILARDLYIEVLGPPTYAYSAMVRTVQSLPVKIKP